MSIYTVEVWKCLGESVTRIFNKSFKSETRGCHDKRNGGEVCWFQHLKQGKLAK